ncbi:hypothetical protein, partial [Salmonella enterica]|uniref:hypothetical protein n=1 Tax=Salmonella enterica TaxID=28901 RepID=UPI001C99989D
RSSDLVVKVFQHNIQARSNEIKRDSQLIPVQTEHKCSVTGRKSSIVLFGGNMKRFKTMA